MVEQKLDRIEQLLTRLVELFDANPVYDSDRSALKYSNSALTTFEKIKHRTLAQKKPYVSSLSNSIFRFMEDNISIDNAQFEQDVESLLKQVGALERELKNLT